MAANVNKSRGPCSHKSPGSIDPPLPYPWDDNDKCIIRLQSHFFCRRCSISIVAFSSLLLLYDTLVKSVNQKVSFGSTAKTARMSQQSLSWEPTYLPCLFELHCAEDHCLEKFDNCYYFLFCLICNWNHFSKHRNYSLFHSLHSETLQSIHGISQIFLRDFLWASKGMT